MISRLLALPAHPTTSFFLCGPRQTGKTSWLRSRYQRCGVDLLKTDLFVFHELSAHRVYSEQHHDLSYWRLPSGIEVDFVINDMESAIEAKATTRVTSDHLRGLREVVRDHRKVKRRILVCVDDRPRRTEDGIDILSAREFAQQLWAERIT